jgi:hypothetical protein
MAGHTDGWSETKDERISRLANDGPTQAKRSEETAHQVHALEHYATYCRSAMDESRRQSAMNVSLRLPDELYAGDKTHFQSRDLI